MSAPSSTDLLEQGFVIVNVNGSTIEMPNAAPVAIRAHAVALVYAIDELHRAMSRPGDGASEDATVSEILDVLGRRGWRLAGPILLCDGSKGWRLDVAGGLN